MTAGKPVPVLLMTYSLGIGGSERQMAEVARALDRRRFEPHVGAIHADGMRARELRAAGVPIVELPVRSFGSHTALLGAWKLYRYIREHGIRLVHSFDVPMNIFAAPVAWLARKPVVLTSQRAHRSLTAGLYHRLLRVTDRITDGIVVNCEFMRRHLMEDEGVPGRLIQLCYNGLDTAVFQPGEREGQSTIGVVCALRPEKDLGTLIAAFERVAAVEKGVRLLIVGSGPELAGLQALARELDVADKCCFEPAADDVVPWLQSIDIFVLPSRSEAFSNSLMVAMACGCCAVASRVGGNPELIRNEGMGCLFEAGNEADLAAILADLIANPGRRRAMAEAGGGFVRSELSIAASVQRMEEIYSERLLEPLSLLGYD